MCFQIKINSLNRGGDMNAEKFSIIELEKHLEEIEPIEEKIKLIAHEIMRCKRCIQDIEDEVKNIDPTNIKFTAKINYNDNSILAVFNSDKELKNAATKELLGFCGKKICEQHKNFLKKAKIDYEYYLTELDIKVKCNGSFLKENENYEPTNHYKRIVWLSGKNKLLNMISALKEKNVLTEYTTEEIMAHFSNEKQVPFNKEFNHIGKLRWPKSDNSFSYFVNELAKRNCIDEENKYMIFKKHFMNKDGKPFKDLAQKKYNTKNFTRTGSMIEKILNSINLIMLFFCSTNLWSDSLL